MFITVLLEQKIIIGEAYIPDKEREKLHLDTFYT